MKTITKYTLLFHRYLGFALSLLFVIWFLSGFAMMYVKYPTMKQNEKLQNLPVIDLSRTKFTLNEALQKANITDTLRAARLGMLLERPVYRITTIQNKNLAIYADNGELLAPTDTILAQKLAIAFVKNRCQPEKLETLTEIDQWMAGARSIGYQPPVHRFKMNDPEKTYVYVSTQTGEVVQMVNVKQRFLAWLGPIPHWIYPTVLLRNRPLWNDIIVWTSSLGTLMCSAGIAMGFIRYKRKNKDSLAFSPYKKKWFRWHHYTGFVFGIFAFTWVFSGLLSMTPWDWAPFTRLNPEENKQWTGGIFSPKLFALSPVNASKIFKSNLALKEIHFTQIQGKPYFIGYQDEMHTELLSADNSENKPFALFPSKPFVKNIMDLNPGASLEEAVVLTDYDDYYYTKNKDKRLPVLRVKMNTPEKTWYYVDLKTGQVVLKHEKKSRLERWLYNGLHSLDFSFLLYKRPLWDIVVIILMLGGLAASSTGLVLTWKWLRRKTKKKAKVGLKTKMII
ncbi:PepSY domain-containing protein [Dyadobacter subterraneus]|uniref:PepSY domain-containing protein n=1 Tax=Dyadobacter subterraneus TaxID=2773304 RepID=A0ABR9WN36_9BACT|nr:PepSY domain-containing protein [Dyadobacter subterraneus]MBE9466509.1 PepSY domain-containing protein [Dyadobacter subterraneus]